MKKALLTVVVALMATVSVNAQRVKRFDTTTLIRAEELMNGGKLDESLAYFEAELKEHPKNPYAHFLMTTVYMEQGQYDYAMPAIDKALKYMPKRDKELRGISHAIKATIHETLQEWEEAIEQLSLCLKVLPDNEASLQHRVVAYKQRAGIYNKIGQHELAEQDIKKAEELKSLTKSK